MRTYYLLQNKAKILKIPKIFIMIYYLMIYYLF